MKGWHKRITKDQEVEIRDLKFDLQEARNAGQEERTRRLTAEEALLQRTDERHRALQALAVLRQLLLRQKELCDAARDERDYWERQYTIVSTAYEHVSMVPKMLEEYEKCRDNYDKLVYLCNDLILDIPRSLAKAETSLVILPKEVKEFIELCRDMTNPMPRHDGTVNAIEVVTEQEFVQQRSSPIDALKRYLLAKGFVLEHNEAFKTTLQRLVNQGVVQFKEYPEEEYVAMLDRNEPLMIPRQGARKTLIIPCAKATLLIPAQVHTRIIPVRDPYPVDKMKAVPWEYESNASTDVTNIVGPGGMTRSGRIFNTAKSKENSAQANDQATVVPTERSTPIDKEITNKDAEEFLALIKKSDYKVVDQLHQTPSRISLLSLLIHSEKHRDTLMKILSAAHVTKDITVNQFDGMVANLTAGTCLSFSEHELPSQGKEHNKALHISIQCGKAHLSRVLIDTGSSLNVMPKATLDKIDLEGLVIRPSRLVVKAFDGSQSPVFGEVDLPVVIGPHTFCINFQVMEIEPAYTCLLGRPWIHAAGAVTSTLHQKVKFVDGNSIVTVSGEEDIFVSNLDSYRYIEAGEKALETSFQALEIATAVTLPIEKTRRAVTSWRDLQDTKMEGWGKIPEVQEKKDRLGLGYQPTKKAAKEEQRFPPIAQTFVTGGYEHKDNNTHASPEA
ncbi:uncharacterized protein LOC131615002 [Vicia villosa]|uniref:uncharacterized protein LOC131615002 n=1 Tax=Vicia villosa TaxID=3911 RepID=UPI00273AC2B1|nr:uncharacterized protein LOC131615002 [Vicia villosa]